MLNPAVCIEVLCYAPATLQENCLKIELRFISVHNDVEDSNGTTHSEDLAPRLKNSVEHEILNLHKYTNIKKLGLF